MRIGRKQVWILLAMLGGVPLCSAQAQGPYSRQLSSECDALMQAAIKKPFGWAWDNVPPVAPAQTATAARHVALGQSGTPAAGLLLLWSGQLLNESRFTQAAIDAARGIAAAQAPAGKIPLHAIFGPGAVGRDDPILVPDRSATIAGLAFFQAIAQLDQPKPELISRAQVRAAQWLLRQQVRDGGWPDNYSYSDDPAHDTITVIRLDNPNYRDATFAMLLLAQNGEDRQSGPAANKATHKLLTLRLSTPVKSPTTEEALNPNSVKADDPVTTQPNDTIGSSLRLPLWSTAYRMTGEIDSLLDKLPAGVDVPATRHAMQTLLADYLLSGDRQDGLALDVARQALLNLRETNGTWKIFYRRDPPTSAPADEAATTQPAESLFHAPPPQVSGTFGLDPTLNAIQQLKLIGRERYLALLAGQPFTLKQQLTATLCGLMDDPLTLEFPVSREEIEPYLKKHESDWNVLRGPIPEDLSMRVRRLWVLLIRAKLERRLTG